MLVQTVTTQEVISEKEINTPSFWKYKKGAALAAIYSEDKTVTIEIPTDTYACITTCAYSSLYCPYRIFKGEEITEQEFNSIMAESIFKIAGVEIETESLITSETN